MTRACLIAGDFDNDGKTDFAVWRPSDGNWYIMDSSTGTQRIPIPQLGNADDIPVPGHYDGDSKTDLAVWHPGTPATWLIIDSMTGTQRTPTPQFGDALDIPVPGDYGLSGDAPDGKTDLAFWRPGTGAWETIDSKTGTQRSILPSSGSPFQAGDIPVPGDYVGDGKTDFAVWRPSDGKWYIVDSTNPTQPPTISKKWGNVGDFLVPGDYVGNGKTDFAFWSPSNGTWYISDVSAANETTEQVGKVGDIPV